ncbi:acetylglutamate kinase, partial [Clostridioides difficile]|nr:acetylglutamate kinase [Clostridioides difficile]
ADDAACAIATAMEAEKLAFLTDVEGVYKDFQNKESLISEMSMTEAQEFVESGMLGGGMLPKLQNCIDAMKQGVSRVHI